MNNIFIDVEKIKVEITRLKKVEERLKILLESLINTNNTLKESWKTKVSEEVYLEFEDYYKYIENLHLKTVKYINFLENYVKNNYVSLEKNIDETIDTNITN